MADDPEAPNTDEPTEEAGAGQVGEPTPEEFEQDPSRNPDDDGLKDLKGG